MQTPDISTHHVQDTDMVTPQVSMVVDDREGASGIPEILRTRFNVSVTETRLSIGDYWVDGHTIVERKAFYDFALSVIDGRLFRQLRRMKRQTESAVMILEGNPTEPLNIALHPHALKGALLSVVWDWHVPLLFSRDAADTALTLWLIAKQPSLWPGELSLRPGRRPKRLNRRQVYILEGLPCVGPTLAARLLDRFGSVEQVICAPTEHLMDVKGVGSKKAALIRAVVSQRCP